VVLSRFFARLAISLAALLIAVIAAAIALVYFVYALFLVLLNVVVAPAAAVLTGVIILLAATLLVVVTRPRSRRGRRREKSPTLEGFENAAELGGELARKLRGLTGTEASGGLLAALVAGFAVGMSPKLRAFLQSILKP
jgi:hypothetical protein